MSKKSVKFNPIETVYTTYSADEYDRSRYASIPMTRYTFRPHIKQDTLCISPDHPIRPTIKPLDLSMIPNSRRRALESPPLNKTCKKPKLSIDTQSLTPLFFSELSTHYKCKSDDEEEEYGYLIPVSAAC